MRLIRVNADHESGVDALSRAGWLISAYALGVAAIGFAGFFAVYTYIAEVVRREAGLSEAWVPWMLISIGLGMTVGNLLGGWAADVNLRRTMLIGFPIFIASMAVLALTAQSVVALLLCGFWVGAANLTLIPGAGETDRGLRTRAAHRRGVGAFRTQCRQCARGNGGGSSPW